MSNYQTIEADRLANQFAALGNINRLRLFISLLKCCGGESDAQCAVTESTCVGDLASTSGIAPSTVSHHLKELRLAGLIIMERHGKQIRCKVDRTALNQLKNFFKAYDF